MALEALAEEFLLRLLVGVSALGLVFVPIWLVLQPSPKNYIGFIRSIRNVRIGGDPSKPRWLRNYFAPVFVSYFLGQAVKTNLHYPLLVDTLGASLLQVGVLDAASLVIAAGVDVVLRAGPARDMSRAEAFALHAILCAFGYCIIIGYMLPHVSEQWLALLLVAMSQVFSHLELTFSEFGVMRNDAKEDIVQDDSVPEEWRDPSRVSAKLSQMQVVLRYPATLAASVTFSPMLSHIFTAYMVVGVGGCLLGLWLALSWRGHRAAEPSQPQAKEAALLEDLRPGGRYFGLIVKIGVFNALSDVVRNGYPRMINLRALTLKNVPTSDIGFLLTVVFGISAMFFWLSDVTPHGKGHRAVSRARRNIGLLGFLLLGTGHVIMGKATGFKSLLCSAVFFGFGQAVSTGLRTVWKDEVRGLLRCHGHGEAYRKRLIRILSSISGATYVANSLAVGIIGETYGMEYASYLYAGVALLGCIWTIFLSLNLNAQLQDCSERWNISMDELTKEDAGLHEPLPKSEGLDPLLRHRWHESASTIYVK